MYRNFSRAGSKNLYPVPYTLYPNQKGFTLIEFLIVTAIGIILAGVFFIGFTQQGDQQELDFAVSSLVSFVRNAEERARGQVDGVSWGVRFTNSASNPDSYAVFSGAIFSEADSIIYLPTAVEFSDPVSGSNKDVVFSKVTGLPDSETSITLRLVSNQSETRTVTINNNGSISF
jgi:prepilin-type N-terminal cleavage/methylation domain-containing protein